MPTVHVGGAESKESIIKSLSLWQPWASLIACGAKTIETRGWSTSYRGPLAIHAAKKQPPVYWHHNVNADLPPDYDLVAMASCWEWTEHPDDFYSGGSYRWRGPLGAVIATCDLVDVVPMVADGDENHDGRFLRLERGGLWIYNYGSGRCADVSKQLPYGDFRPGRYAWILDGVAPTTDRCPACRGAGREADPDGRKSFGYPQDWRPCSLCHGEKVCEPVPARGRQGLWNWTPETVASL